MLLSPQPPDTWVLGTKKRVGVAPPMTVLHYHSQCLHTRTLGQLSVLLCLNSQEICQGLKQETIIGHLEFWPLNQQAGQKLMEHLERLTPMPWGKWVGATQWS